MTYFYSILITMGMFLLSNSPFIYSSEDYNTSLYEYDPNTIDLDNLLLMHSQHNDQNLTIDASILEPENSIDYEDPLRNNSSLYLQHSATANSEKMAEISTTHNQPDTPTHGTTNTREKKTNINLIYYNKNPLPFICKPCISQSYLGLNNPRWEQLLPYSFSNKESLRKHDLKEHSEHIFSLSFNCPHTKCIQKNGNQKKIQSHLLKNHLINKNHFPKNNADEFVLTHDEIKIIGQWKDFKNKFQSKS